MSVLIKGMEMPESCNECRFFVDAWCYALDVEDWRNAYNKPPKGERLKGCPLAETEEPRYTGCSGCVHYDQQQTALMCRDCKRSYRDMYEED